ncbi:carboxylesterase [Solibacillus sp. R5-41]|uniref:alpha/beta hydrolase n=1 Tax=Solibacillus sp. R5-41 TaxID=2048654 RepID=UPI000C128F13|nr:carboxylesterase [Solibacillus sp. R5-41]ATP41709.1 carboxylesterase [Solibacillus sp. R5-41]
MKKAMSTPFLFEAGSRAVLLLHGFTGSSADVRILGRFLENNGYTSHAPHYKGHGVPPEELIVTSPDDWWQDVLNGYDTLKQAGYEEIAVAGLSLGGVFSLKLALQKPVKGVITMCSPMSMRTTHKMFEGVIEYAQQYKKQEGKNEQKIELEIEALKNTGMASLPQLQQLIQEVRQSIDLLYAPILVVQSRQDDVIDPHSANIIYSSVESIQKELKWFEQSGHVITLDKERNQLHDDVLAFLNSLDWTV